MAGLSISIVTFNTWERTSACIASLTDVLASAGPEFEILVWDNGTEPPPADIDPAVVINRPGVNSGFGSGHNSNAALAQHSYLLVLNPDTSVVPGCIERLVEVMEADGTVVAAAPLQYSASGQLQSSVRRLPSLRTELARVVGADRRVGSRWSTLIRIPTTGVVRAPQPSGAALLTRTQTFLDVGGFDPGYFMYFEDVDLAGRLAELGWIAVVADARIVHDGEGTARRYRKETTFWIEYSRRIYFRKHFAFPTWMLLYAVAAASAASHFVGCLCVGVLAGGEGAEARAKAYGYAAALGSLVLPIRPLWARLMRP